MFVLLETLCITNDYSQEFIDSIINSGESLLPYMESEKVAFNVTNISTIGPDNNTGGSVITMVNGEKHSVKNPINELFTMLNSVSVLHLNN